MQRDPKLQRFLDKVADECQISAEERAVLDAASGHPFSCKCSTCAEWWKLCGPDPDTRRFGPFTAEELGLTPEQVEAMLPPPEEQP